MNYKIIEIFLDMSDKYRARVIIDETTQETAFFRFDHYPTQEEINRVANDHKQSLIVQIQE